MLENQNKTELFISSTGKIVKKLGNIPQLADIHQNLGRTAFWYYKGTKAVLLCILVWK